MHMFITKYSNYFLYRLSDGSSGSCPYVGESDFFKQLHEYKSIFELKSFEVREESA